jgi:hypothetical protein
VKKNIIIIILAISTSAFTFAQKMQTPTLIKAGGKIIDCKYTDAYPYAAPTIYDFDNDGLQDLIVGTYEGKFRFYKNTGTKNSPAYNNFILIQANGKNAKIPNS